MKNEINVREFVDFAEMAYNAMDEYIYQIEFNEKEGLEEKVEKDRMIVTNIRKKLSDKLDEFGVLGNEELIDNFSSLALSVGLRIDNQKLLSELSKTAETNEEILKLKKYVDRVNNYSNDIEKIKEIIIAKMTEMQK